MLTQKLTTGWNSNWRSISSPKINQEGSIHNPSKCSRFYESLISARAFQGCPQVNRHHYSECNVPYAWWSKWVWD
jgi:hypothetical protein